MSLFLRKNILKYLGVETSCLQFIFTVLVEQSMFTGGERKANTVKCLHLEILGIPGFSTLLKLFQN